VLVWLPVSIVASIVLRSRLEPPQSGDKTDCATDVQNLLSEVDCVNYVAQLLHQRVEYVVPNDLLLDYVAIVMLNDKATVVDARIVQ